MGTRTNRTIGLALVLVIFAGVSGCSGGRPLRSSGGSSPLARTRTEVRDRTAPVLAAAQAPAAAMASAETEPPPPATPPPPTVTPNTTEPPALIGKRLKAGEPETATQRAIELAKKLDESDAERKRLANQVEELEFAIRAKDEALELARAEVQSARTQMARAREELEQWKQEIAALRDRVRGADEENLQTLQTAVALLQQLLSQSAEQDQRAASAAEEQHE